MQMPQKGSATETWDLWYPKAAATGVPFARGRLDPTETLIVHAAPDVLTVEVRDDAGKRVALGRDLPRTDDAPPMARLRCIEGRVTREDAWPEESDIGRPVILPGGEVGIIREWWNAPDGSEWRWP